MANGKEQTANIVFDSTTKKKTFLSSPSFQILFLPRNSMFRCWFAHVIQMNTEPRAPLPPSRGSVHDSGWLADLTGPIHIYYTIIIVVAAWINIVAYRISISITHSEDNGRRCRRRRRRHPRLRQQWRRCILDCNLCDIDVFMHMKWIKNLWQNAKGEKSHSQRN